MLRLNFLDHKDEEISLKDLSLILKYQTEIKGKELRINIIEIGAEENPNTD